MHCTGKNKAVVEVIIIMVMIIILTISCLSYLRIYNNKAEGGETEAVKAVQLMPVILNRLLHDVVPRWISSAPAGHTAVACPAVAAAAAGD